MLDIAGQIISFVVLMIAIIGCSMSMFAIFIILFKKKTPEEQATADEEQMEALKKWREERSNK